MDPSSESTLFWSAFGGFAGVLGFFFVKWVIERITTRKKFVVEYLCASELNQGQPTESAGELMHHHGKRISDIEELKVFRAKNPVWEWTRDAVGNGSGASIIYGPYTTDFIEPGVYSVTFTIK